MFQKNLPIFLIFFLSLEKFADFFVSATNTCVRRLLKSPSFHSGILLAGSAIAAKFFGLWRDRLFVQHFAESGQVDFVFAAFRIPDFFFFLLVGGTVSTLFLPRMANLKKSAEKTEFFSSFVWLVIIGFGIISGLGIVFAEQIVPIFAAGFERFAQLEIANLARYLFGSVFILSVSSVFAAFLQNKEKFLSIAVAPILYTAGICIGVYYLAADFGLISVGWAALGGALLHLFSNVFAIILQKQKIIFSWKKPRSAWKNFSADFFYRVGNSAAFQVNQSADVLIASFLVAGSVTAFSIGTALGHVLLSVVGFSAANVLFPKLAQNKFNPAVQKSYLLKGSAIIFALTVPFSLIVSVFSVEILNLLYTLSGEMLAMAATVFVWTVWSLPCACLTPLFARAYFANDDTKTPTKYTIISLTIATSLAAYLSLVFFSESSAILGLAIGNFTANILSASLFGWGLWKKYS